MHSVTLSVPQAPAAATSNQALSTLNFILRGIKCSTLKLTQYQSADHKRT